MSRFVQMCFMGILSAIIVLIIGAKVERPWVLLAAYFIANLWHIGANAVAAIRERDEQK